LNFARDKETGKPKGYCFLKYDDQRSTILAVDNLNGIKVCLCCNQKIRGRVIRVDHVSKYRRPGAKDGNLPAWADMDEESAAMNVAPQMIYYCTVLSW
jgi:RNA-binding motif X-linked protein 2